MIQLTELGITELETDVMNAIRTSGFYDSGRDPVWSDYLHDSCEICEKSQLSGVVGSLVKKGLVLVDNKDTTETCVQYTETGLKMMEKKESSPSRAL
jgi:hypothetical protein